MASRKHHPPNKPNLNGVSVIVPTLNEEECVDELVERLARALADQTYEIIFVDDHSSDKTVEHIQRLSGQYPIRVFLKEGQRGKAFSLVQGFANARYDIIAMIDADLQYPPEALTGMVAQIVQDKADVLVADRHPERVAWIRKFLSRGFRRVFGRALWRLDVDIQSGLKMFRKEVLERATLNPSSGWTFDLEFLVSARSGGYRLGSYDITFYEREKGYAKVKWLIVSKELGWSALRLRLKAPHYVPFHPRQLDEHGQGFHFRGSAYTTHTQLSRDEVALERMFPVQRIVVALLLAVMVGFLVLDWFATLLVLVSLITILYFFDLLFNLYLILRSFFKNAEIQVSEASLRAVKNWPRYTIFCPLYKESEVVPQFIEAMQELDYPKQKLQVLLLLEEDDEETIRDIRAMTLPDYFEIEVVPHAMPKTKPKACNYGLLRAKGEYAVIYDAEDIPDPLQLKKAVVAFRTSDETIGCIQAKLNYYNWSQNILTRLFTLEYSLWFNLVLSGLQSINAPIPLGGTSNHFRVRDLRGLAGWDPFNVTEDADLGIRLASRGFRTAILDSYTMEEANSEFRNWLRQRSRWIKGYMQTYLVHMRRPSRLYRQKRSHVLFLQLVIGGKVLSMIVNPLFWLTTATYLFVPGARDFINSLYIGPIFYMGAFALVFGNFLYMYYYMVGASEQRKPELIPYALLIPGYWLMMSWAAVYAARDLLVRPHHWHKTKHGLHLRKEQAVEQAMEPVQ